MVEQHRRITSGPAVRVALALAMTAAACSGGRPESPESTAREIFQAVRDNDLAGFLARMAKLSDYQRQCPEMTAAEINDATVELAEAEAEARRGFEACRQLVQLDGATFDSAARSPSEGEIFTPRYHGCASTLSFPAIRVLFLRGGTRGNVYVIHVADIGGRWVHRGGVRLCEQSVPR